MRIKHNTKLLIVDDLFENLKALDAIIRAEDREIFKASSGEEALELLLNNDFALAILDVEMPGMNGFELAELMRGTERTRQVPIVFVTAAGNELNYSYRSYEAGAVDFLYKPLDINAVKSKVNVFVELFQHRMEVEYQVSALEKSRLQQALMMEELEVTKSELQHSLKMRDEFMSMVAHEMRTPLNTLFLDVQVRASLLVQNKMEAFNPVELNKMLARNKRQLQSMIRLIDDMLDVSRLRSGKLSIKPAETNLSELIDRIVSDLSQHALDEGSSLTLRSSDNIIGTWDEFRIEQIIINLLTNAIRYGQRKPVLIEVKKDESHIYIEVQDQGVGISKADITRIFDPFERGLDNKVSAGLGLGLYISKQLAQAHNGDISVQSELEKGSVFTLILPAATA